MPEETNNLGGALLSPEGVMMLFIAGFLDFLSIVCAILILAFGVGVLLGRIVYVFGLIIISFWQLFRQGSITPNPGEGKGGKAKAAMEAVAKKFFKKQWKKLAVKAIPAIGDIIPLWTWTVYSELKSS